MYLVTKFAFVGVLREAAQVEARLVPFMCDARGQKRHREADADEDGPVDVEVDVVGGGDASPAVVRLGGTDRRATVVGFGTYGVVVTVPGQDSVFKIGLKEDMMEEYGRHQCVLRRAEALGGSRDALLDTVCLTRDGMWDVACPLLPLDDELLAQVVDHVKPEGSATVGPSDLGVLPLQHGGASWLSMADAWKVDPAGFLGELAALLDALVVWRDAGLVHCDLKDCNVVYDGTRTRLIDLGMVVSWAEARPTRHMERLLLTGFNACFPPELRLLSLVFEEDEGGRLNVRRGMNGATTAKEWAAALRTAIRKVHGDAQDWLSPRWSFDPKQRSGLDWGAVDPAVSEAVLVLADLLHAEGPTPNPRRLLRKVLPYLTAYQFGTVLVGMCCQIRFSQTLAQRQAFQATQAFLWNIVGRCMAADWTKRPSLEALQGMVADPP